MTSEKLKRVWAMMDAHRGKQELTLDRVVHLAFDNNIPLNPRELWRLATQLGKSGGVGVCPPLVAEFIADLIGDSQPSRILDPWAGRGTLLTTLVQRTKAGPSVGICADITALETASLLRPEGREVAYRQGNIAHDGFSPNELFDVVAVMPPFGLRTKKFKIDGVEFTDEEGHELFLKATTHLRDGGIGVLVGLPLRILKSRKRGFLARLGDLGLHLDGLFRVPEGVFSPLTMIPTAIAVVRHGPAPQTVFVGEVSEDAKRSRTLLENYVRRKSAREPQLGWQVSLNEYQGFPQLLLSNKVKEHTRRLSLPAIRLGDIATLNRCPLSREAIDETENSFFLPLPVQGRVRLSVAELPERPRDYIHVVVDADKADAKVVAGFLNSPLGRDIRGARATGATIQRIRVQDISDLPLWLPDVAEQQAIIELDQRLRELNEEVNGLREQLWLRLDRSKQTIDALKRVNREDTFPDWLDTLPFPLASILWTYHTLKDQPLKRYFQLDYFFEGLVQYLAILMLSVVRRDEAVFRGEWKTVKDALNKKGMSLDHSTFGVWMAIYSRFSKKVRGGLNQGRDAKARWLGLLACDDEALALALVSKKMVTLAAKANKLRNDWRGHGGMVSDSEARRRDTRLRELLLDFRSLVGRRWGNYPVFLPEGGRFVEGRHHYIAKRVMGVRTPFDKTEVAVIKPMEDGMLHVVSLGTGQATPLLPLVRLGDSPREERNACYFFNRVEGDGFRYVSFHNENRAEITAPFMDTRRLLDELARPTRP